MAQQTNKAWLILEDGTCFAGYSMGKAGTAIGEVVFNTCTASYESLLSDPTYYGQIVAQTYPLVGNRGVSKDGDGSEILANGYIVREWCDAPDGDGLSLHDFLAKRGIVGICGVDTRRLTRALRDKGYMRGAITDSKEDMPALLEKMRTYSISGAVEAVSVKAPEHLGSADAKLRVAALDYGSPREILGALLSRDCAVDLLPAFYTAEQVQAFAPNGILLSDGPADPDDNPTLIENIRAITQMGIPILAVGLGHQMLALAAGAKIVKMPQGHRGSNQPVLIEESRKLMITNQNHGYCVETASVDPKIAEIVFTNVNDKSVEGLSYKVFNALGVQFTPSGDLQSSTSWIFDSFVEKMQEGRV